MKQYHKLKTLINMLENHMSVLQKYINKIEHINLSVYEQYHECQNMYKVIKTIPAQAGKVMTPTQHH